MFKVCILLALAAVGALAQEAANQNGAAPEPYSFAYTTDSHAASEQKDPQGRVTGFYTLVDADGRERRVEYVADEGGFRAKVATNEVGTKSENPADVEINASEPTPQQFAYVYQQAPAQVQYQAPRVVQQTAVPSVTTVQQPVRQQVAYSYQQPLYGYGYAGNNGYYNTGYYNAPGYAYGSGYGYNGYNGYNGGLFAVGNYNNHLPSQYYRSVSTSGPATYTVNGLNSGYRYVSQPAVSGVRTVSYGVAPGVTTTRSSNQGSSNYLVIQKRAADEKKN